ncbi:MULTISPECIES: MFS transporter [unclassified Streptomyces]|uniref:MFS transporter n=1 Tax=unclassified Streptomyces TaxID=2593676 RepID=UPI00234AF622|nr:MFS transporter [Streptomyces sp. M92]WCN02034.1 MFS transporter [Streptomyces sp. M92]
MQVTASPPADARAKPLRHHQVWIRWLAAASLARLPQTALPVALVLTAHEATGSFMGSGLLSGASAMTYAVCAPWRGRQMDRAVLPHALGWSLLAATAGLVATSVAAAAGAPLWLLLVFVVLAACAGSGVGGAYRSILPHFLHPSQLTQAYAADAVAVQVAWIGGPALAAVVAAAIGPQACVGVVAAVTAAGALLSWTLPRREPGSATRHHASVRALLGLLWAPLVLNAGIGINLGALDVALPALMTEHGEPATNGGLVLAGLFATSAVSGSVYAGLPSTNPLRKVTTRTVACVLVAAYGAVMAGAAAAPELWVSVACLLVAGLAFAPGDSAVILLVSEQAPAERLAEAFGYFSAIGYLGIALAGPVTGWFVTRVGAGAGLLLAGLAPLAAVVLVTTTRGRQK